MTKYLLLVTAFAVLVIAGCKPAQDNQSAAQISAPTVSPKIISSTQIDVFWDIPAGEKATSYNLKVNDKEVLTGHTYLSAPVKDLTPNMTYKFEVQAVDAAGKKSPWSKPASVATTP